MISPLTAIGGLGAGLGLAWCGLQAYSRFLLYPPNRRTVPDEPDFEGLDVEEVHFAAMDGTALHGLWFGKPDAKGTMLICHGNGGSVYNRVWMPKSLQDVPINLFIFDYRGYGRSKGIPSEKGTALDVAAAWEVVHARMGRPEDPPILLYGRSLGGGVALQLPSTCPVKGVVIESSFTSVLEIAMRNYPWLLPKITCRHPYRSDLRIPQVTVPVLVAHGREDQTIPFDMGESLYQLAQKPWRFCELQGSHDESGWDTTPAYAEAFREFVDYIGVV